MVGLQTFSKLSFASQEIANATVLIDEKDNTTIPYTYYNSSCMTYQAFCEHFGLRAEDPASDEVCLDAENNKTMFSELYKRYEHLNTI